MHSSCDLGSPHLHKSLVDAVVEGKPPLVRTMPLVRALSVMHYTFVVPFCSEELCARFAKVAATMRGKATVAST